MATDPMNPLLPLAARWGAQAQPATAPTAPVPDPSGSSLDRSTLEAMAAGPQIAPPVPGASAARKTSVEGASEARRDRLAGASEHRRALVGGNETAIQMEAAAAANGNETDDLRGLTWSEKLRVKENVTSAMFDQAEIESKDRTTGEVVSDTAVSVGKGIGQGLGSLATLGGAVIDPELGIGIAKANTEFGQWADGLKSDTINDRRELVGLRNQLDSEENQKEYDQNLAEGDSEFVAGLKKIGSDFIDTSSNYLADGGLVGELTTEGVGSLAGSAGVGGFAAKLVGKGLTKFASKELADRAVMGGVIGTMEGGDAYSNAALQVMNTSEEDLRAQSPEYVSLRESGMTHEQAQIELAHNSGMGAAAIAVPAGALGGAVVGKFERFPLGMKGAGIADAVKTTGSQFVEESYQEGVSALAGNVGLRWSGANPEADLTEGVGESAAMGGIGGAGMGAAISGPKAALKTPENVAKAIVSIANYREQAAEEKQSPVSTTAVQTAIQESKPAEVRIQEAVKTVPEDNPVRRQLDSLMTIPADEINSLMPNLRPALEGKSRTDGLFSLVQALDDEKLNQKEKDQALLYIKAVLPRVGQVIGGDLRDRVAEMSPGMENDIDVMADTIGRMIANPKVAKALGIEITPQQIENLVNDEDTQTAVNNTAMVAEVSPTAVPAEKAQEVLNHARAGSFKVNPEAIRFLAMAADLGDLIQEHKNTLDQTFKEISSEGISKVRNDAFITGRGKQPSMVQHIDRVSNSVRGGQMEQAKAEMEEFRLFAEGQKNKLAAMEASKANGDGNAVKYAVNTEDGWLDASHERAKSVTYLRGRGAATSELLLQNMRADTKAIERAYQRVSEAFPELDVKASEPVKAEAPQGRRQGIKDVQIDIQDEEIQNAEGKQKEYRPRKGTVLPSAVGSLVEREVSQEEAEALKTKIDLHLDDEGRVPRDKLTKAELKILRDNYGVQIHHKNVRIPEELAQETIAIRQALEAESDPEAVDLGRNERDVSSRDVVEERTEETSEGSEESNRETARASVATGIDGTDESSHSDAIRDEPTPDLNSGILTDDNGKAITFYHATKAEFDEFAPGMTFWSSNKNIAYMFGRGKQGEGKVRVVEAQIKAENPAYIDAGDVEELDVFQNEDAINRDRLFEQGHDVVVYFNQRGALVITSDNKQVLQQKPEEFKIAQTKVEEIQPEPEVTLTDLVPDTSENFQKAYRVRKDGSKLLTEASPIKTISGKVMERAKGGVTQALWKGLMDNASNIVAALNENLLGENAQKRIADWEAQKPSSNGIQVQDQAIGRILNLVKKNDKGQHVFNEKLAEVAGIAFVHWLMNERKPDRNRIDDTDVAAIFRTDADLVTTDMFDVVASGTYIQNAVASLAETIQKFAGLDPVTDVTRSDAGGIVLALAAETMSAALKAGYFKLSDKTVEVPKPNGSTEKWPYNAVQITDPGILDFQKQITQSGDLSLLEELIVPEADKIRYVGEPPKKIDPTQMKNRETELTGREKRAIKNEQEKPAYANVPYIRLMKAIGRDNWLKILGYKPTDESVRMNVKHRESVEGKNTSLVYGWDGIEGHMAEIERVAAEKGLAVEDVPSFWAYGISKVGRLQQRGFGPQGDKQAREALTSTVAVLDLNDQAQNDKFWMTIAQSIGIKTEKITRAEAVAKAKQRMSHPLVEEAIGPLFFLVQDENATLSTEEVDGIVRAIEEITQNKDLGIGEITPKVMHAFLSVARYWAAKENGGFDKFKHNLALESDGKTDGPINAIMNFLSGTFAPIQLKLMAMGGMFVNQKAKTLNSHFAEGGKDLYEHTSALFENRLLAMRDSMDAKTQSAMDTAIRFLSITGNVKVEDGKIKVGRGVVKNPLTVSVYGAGNAGIAGKVTREVMDAVYAAMTDSLTGAQDVNDIVEQLKVLVNNKIVYNTQKGKWFVFPAQHNSHISKVDGEKFQLNGDQYRQLRDNIKVLFSDPMVESINEMMGETKRTMTLFQNSTQIQAAVAQEKFRKRVEELKATKKVGEDLSDKEYWQVFKEIAPYGAQIYMPDQSANMGVSEKLGAYNPDPEKRKTDMVGSLDNKIKGNLKTLQPSEAGVKAAPFMVIMTGDAQMVLRLSSEGLEKTLMVFDGVEMAADLMDEQSLKINKVVMDGWSQDTSGAVADSFENFLRQNPLSDMETFSDDTLKAIDRALTGDMKTRLSNEQRKASIMALQDSLRQTSDEIRARKETMQEFAFSVDHMASAEQPFSNDKSVVVDENGIPLTGAVLAQKMNETFQQKLESIQSARSERQTKEKPNAGLVALVQEGASNVRGKKGGVVSLSVSQMFEAVKTAKNSFQRQMFHSALSALRKSGYTFHFGTREELVKLRETLSPGIDQALDLGQTDPDGKHVYIASATTETALHETIHAATIDKVFAAVTSPESVTQAVREAVDRLGLLMEEFMGFDFNQLAGDQAGIQAQETIQSHLKKGIEAGRAYAINEFMAWSMSNQQLIEVMQKTKVQNPVARVVWKVLRTIKGLLGMDTIPDSMFANVRFNIEVILQEPMNVEVDVIEALNHTTGSNGRLNDVLKNFTNVFRHAMNTMEVDSAFSKKAKREFKARNRADLEMKVMEVTDIFESAGFQFTDQQRTAFAMIQKAMMTAVQMHSPSLMRAQAMYRHVLTNLKPEDFMANPQSTNPNDIKLAQDKFNAVTGAYGFRRDAMGRTSLLGSFLALSQVDPEFRAMLAKIKPPKGDGASPVASSRFDEIVTAGFNSLTETASSMLYDGPLRKSSVGGILDSLMVSMSVIQEDTRTRVEKAYDQGMNKAENLLVTATQAGIDGGIELLNKARKKSKNQITNAMLNAGQSILALGSNRYAQAYADEKTSLFNSEKTPNFIRDLFAEMRGTHSTNENLHNMVGKVKYEVSGNRQDYLEVLPHTILNKFKKKLKPENWYALSRAITNTDLANTLSRYSLNRVTELLADGRKLNGEIAALERKLGALAPMHSNLYVTKAEALATYMVTGDVTSKNLLTNAVAISRLLGERSRPSQVPSREIVEAIDDLVTMKALQKTAKADKEFLQKMLETETEAMDFMLRYMNELDRREKSKTKNQRALFNHIKGQVDTVRAGSEHVIVAEDSEFKDLTRMGYVRIGDYKGDSNDPGKRGYYMSPVSGQSTYHQGVMQTVQQTVYGVDAMTGYMVGNIGGRIKGATARRIAADLFKQKKDNLPAGEYLKPVYDENGNAVAFERMLTPAMLARTKKDDHLATRIGAWRGRQAEEAHATEYNTQLVGVLKDYWEEQKADHTDEFIDLADPNQRDRVTDHIWKIIPKEMKAEIDYAFGMTEEGKSRFMVRRDMLNDALGYPGASLGDVFTGKNRIPQSVNNASRQMLTALMGTKAYPWLVQTEQLWQSAVSAAKTTMVIRSVVIPMANIVSNVFQLLLRRVPLRYFGKPMMQKIAETNTFLRNKVRLAELEAEGVAARGDVQKTAALRAKYRAIEDENKRLSIWPLIERGEFATISDGLSEADKVVDNAKIMDMIEAQVNRLPEGVKTVGKYAIVSRDTALFKLLNRSVQYGDFIAKALLYEHNLAQGMSKEDAYRGIRNEFVNYNLLPGRLRTALESLGLLWFYNFKIRSIKTALSVIRNNPLSALIWSLSPVRDIPINGFGDSVLTDNLISKGLEDKLHHSMGPGMVTMIYESNPWIRFMNS